MSEMRGGRGEANLRVFDQHLLENELLGLHFWVYLSLSFSRLCRFMT